MFQHSVVLFACAHYCNRRVFSCLHSLYEFQNKFYITYLAPVAHSFFMISIFIVSVFLIFRYISVLAIKSTFDQMIYRSFTFINFFLVQIHPSPLEFNGCIGVHEFLAADIYILCFKNTNRCTCTVVSSRIFTFP